MIVIQGPTLANPEAFNTLPELRRELHRANADLLRYSAALQERDAVGNEFAGLINAVLMQHLRGDHRGVAAILNAQLDANPRLRERLEETNESNDIRQARKWEEASRSEKRPEPLPPYDCEGDDPWSKKTVPELQVALDIANRTGVSLVSELAALQSVMEQLTAEVSKIVVAHVKGDRDAVSEAVSTFCEKRVVVKGDPKRKVH